MKLYNTLTRKVEEVNPINPPVVTVYTCGPTVYDYPHIGNWFTFIRYDILIRALKASGLKPKWVMNVTDVGHLVSDADEGEDKLEKGAKREGKSAWQVAEFYTDYFTKGLDRLNITEPDQLPRATEHIQEQIDLIKDLEKKGYTYTISDGVYYDTSKFPDYGKMARLDIANLKEGARVQVNADKRNPTDFALWKFSPKDKKRDMEWDSTWGKGFPGWHLECSAMSMKYLGETLDIHAGGIEHIPVHHTNEIAQSEGATGKKFANIWVHMNHILTGGEKISKSTGNGITLEDIEKKGYSLEALRLLVLESHYRTQAEFTWETLESAQNRLKDYHAMAALRFQTRKHSDDASMYVLKEVAPDLVNTISNDLDTPSLLARLSDISSQLSVLLIDEENGNRYNNLKDFTALLETIDQISGLSLMRVEDISEDQKRFISQREESREAKDWAKSDDIRGQLEKQGIGLRDTDHGPIWFRL
ncbi:MAG TPA: cysteine--tRNA ligase [Patescibacteria group bacterium]|nr:cysteine--tRNA ligase [Patescibacteria group bacterium]